MKISYITNNFRPNIKFTSSWEDTPSDESSKIKKHNINQASEQRLRDTGLAAGGLLTTLAALSLLFTHTNHSTKDKDKQFIENALNTIQSDDIRKDTLVIKDITDDDKPELILYKNDGSKVVIDIANQQVLEETTKLTPVK